MKVRTVLIATAAIAAMFVGSVAQAQARARRTIAVALVDTLSRPGLRAEILRFSDASRPDVILLPRGTASSEDLAAAIASYRSSVARAPSRPGLVGRTALTGYTADGASARPLRARATEMLAAVRRAKFARVGNYGRGQWTTFEVSIRG